VTNWFELRLPKQVTPPCLGTPVRALLLIAGQSEKSRSDPCTEHRSALRAFFQRRIRSKADAPDLVQEVYLRMLQTDVFVMNAKGQLSGAWCDVNGACHGFVMKPVDEED
jgi:hypothetical protein